VPKGAAIVVGLFWNYLLYHYVVFRHRPVSPVPGAAPADSA